ncbi:MAG: nucleoside hydrolase [Chitinivibrionales bacterium]|nr:nucleoside hydrolase [Chitinivibrionales bacterium]MBD3396618.1 nucleoside hydrolase [Chitinivibrionales bacterium]
MRTGLAAIAMLIAAAICRADAPRIIFDTDMCSDIDDIAALGMLHALADNGECIPLGMMLSSGNDDGIAAISAMNHYHNRPDLPIGSFKGAGKSSPNYYGAIPDRFPCAVRTRDDVPDAVSVYRRILASQPDASVTIVTVGYLHNIRDLLQSGADQHSDLSGVQLVAAKVKEWSCMGGSFWDANNWSFEWNLCEDGAASKYAIDHFPSAIVFSGYEIGDPVKTGVGYGDRTPAENPARAVYDPNYPDWPRQEGHCSFDQTAVLHAARGIRNYWDANTTGYCEVNDAGYVFWHDSPDKEHGYLIRKMDNNELAGIINELMFQQPFEGESDPVPVVRYGGPNDGSRRDAALVSPARVFDLRGRALGGVPTVRGDKQALGFGVYVADAFSGNAKAARELVLR